MAQAEWSWYDYLGSFWGYIYNDDVIKWNDFLRYWPFALLAIHRWPVNSPHRGPVPRKMFTFDDVIMIHDSGMASREQRTVALWNVRQSRIFIPNLVHPLLIAHLFRFEILHRGGGGGCWGGWVGGMLHSRLAMCSYKWLYCWSRWVYPNSKVHGANKGPICGRQDPGGPHVSPMNFAIWVGLKSVVDTSSFDRGEGCSYAVIMASNRHQDISNSHYDPSLNNASWLITRNTHIASRWWQSTVV